MIKFRVYANGSLVFEDDFAEHDNTQPYYDDYWEGSVSRSALDQYGEESEELLEYIRTLSY